MAKESHLQGGRSTAGSLAKQGRFPSGTLETAREDACAPEANNTFAVGAFFSSQDADSEGREGTFYVWSWDELTGVVGEPVARALGAEPGNRLPTSKIWFTLLK